MSLAFLPNPMSATVSSWSDDSTRAVRVLGYDDTEGEWIVLSHTGEVEWLDSMRVRFQSAPDYEAVEAALERLLRFTHALTAADHGAPFRAGAELGDLHFAEAVVARLRDKVPA